MQWNPSTNGQRPLAVGMRSCGLVLIYLGFWAPKWGAPHPRQRLSHPGTASLCLDICLCYPDVLLFQNTYFFSSTFVFGHVKYNRGLVLLLVLQIPWPFLVFHDLTFSCHFRKFQNVTCFSIFFDLTQFNRNKLWYTPKCVPFVLFNYSSLSYITLALSSAVTNLPNKTLIFHDFQGPKMKFHDFPGLENEILKFHDFPDFVFHDLYEHCNRLWFPEVWNESLRCER